MAIMEKDVDQVQALNEFVIEFVKRQEDAIQKLNHVLEEMETKVIKKAKPSIDLRFVDLAKALHTIEENRDERRRITWKEAQDKKKLIFAYLRRAEADGLDIEKTTEMQRYPTYRRVFQHVVNHISPWKDIIEEYRKVSSLTH